MLLHETMFNPKHHETHGCAPLQVHETMCIRQYHETHGYAATSLLLNNPFEQTVMYQLSCSV
jgi:hypothetical protein